MSPIPISTLTPSPPPLLLELHFPTRSSLSSPSLQPRISQAAHSTSSLTILVKFNFDLPTHSTPSIPSSSFAAPPPTSASSASGSSSTPATIDQSDSSLFELLESLLGNLYSYSTEVFITEDRPLDTVDVVLAQVRKLPLCWDGKKEVFVVKDHDGSAIERRDIEGQYQVCALGGTFDHLHAGHKILLSLATVLATRRLVVGVTDAALLKNKVMAIHLESLQTRINKTKAFLELFKPEIEYDVVPIQDVYGPTAWDAEIEALIVSDETRGGGDAVNKERERKQLSALDIFVIKLVGYDGSVDGVEVSTKMGSTGIRKWIDAREKAKKQ